MSNRASNHLHELIKSLSSAEKRYFTLFSERHQSKEKKTYIQLFEEIGKQDEYDEAKILDKFSDAAIAKHFSIAKNRLYHHILKSLDAFHAHNSTEAELNQYLHYAEILFDKSLYSQCGRILNTAEKLALKYQKWGALIQIIKRQKRLAETDHYEKSNGDEIETLYKTEQETLSKLNAESELWLSKSRIFFTLFQKGQVRNREEAADILPEVENVVALSKSAPESFEAGYLAYHTQSAYYFSLADYEKSYKALKSNLELVESHLEVIKDEPAIYTGILTNLIYVSAKLNKFKEVDIYLEKNRKLPKTLMGKFTENMDLRIFTNTYSLELAICNITGNITRGKQLISELEYVLPKWESKLSDVRKASFYHAISTLCFIAADVKKALHWNNELLNSIPIDKTEDQFCFAQMFHLLIHIELNNYELLPYTLKSLTRYLETRKRQFRFEKLFVEFVKNIFKAEDSENRLEHIKTFSESMSALEKDPFEKPVFEYFDFQAWAEAKITDQPIAKLLQVKAPGKDIL